MKVYRDEDVDQLRESFHKLHDWLLRGADKATETAQRQEALGLDTSGASAEWGAKLGAALAIRERWHNFDRQYGGPRLIRDWNWSPDRPARSADVVELRPAGNELGTESPDQGGSGGK